MGKTKEWLKHCLLTRTLESPDDIRNFSFGKEVVKGLADKFSVTVEEVEFLLDKEKEKHAARFEAASGNYSTNNLPFLMSNKVRKILRNNKINGETTFLGANIEDVD